MVGMFWTLLQLKTGIRETDTLITKINRTVVSFPLDYLLGVPSTETEYSLTDHLHDSCALGWLAT